MRGVIFIDRPESRARRLARAWQAELGAIESRVLALEPPKRGSARRGVVVADFFAGDLRTPGGESVWLAAHRLGGEAAFRAAEMTLAQSPTLSRINTQLGRDTVRLLIAKRCWSDASMTIMKMLVARALTPPGETAHLVVGDPESFPADVLDGIVEGLQVRYYSRRSAMRARSQFVARATGSISVRRLRRLTKVASPGNSPSGQPAVLMTHENELTTDRRVRSQPYWLDPASPAPSFRSLVLPTLERFNGSTPTDLGRLGVHPLTEGDLARSWRRRGRGRVETTLRRAMLRALRAAVRGPSYVAFAAAHVAVLLEYARLIHAVVRDCDVRCLHTGEPHMVHADAMAVVSELTGVPLVAYQYSNLAAISPPMCPTSDYFVVFARGFEPLWNHHGIRPGTFTEAGYPYDAVFRRVRDRSRELRSTLERAGARFVVCYLDESVQHDRYGLISREHHRSEVIALARRVITDDTFGLVVKSQFARNSPSRLYADEPYVRQARETGRYVELLRGIDRNVVFPAEAAMASDISIGHMVGATAALEAALAGCRSLIIDGYRQVRFRRDLYERADVVYASVDDALEAIDRFRAGDARAACLGDWSPILPEFDPFRDGHAPDRLRALIERVVSETKSVV